MYMLDSPPFARGETFYNGGTIDANDPVGLGGVNLEGKLVSFEVNSADDPVGSDPSGRPIVCRIVRNKSSIALKGKRLVTYRLNTDSPLGTAVDGYTTGVATPAAGMVDEFLPAAGVPVNDLFYIVIDGPTVGTSVTTGLTSLAIGDNVVPGTGTSGVSSDAGCLQAQSLTGATATLGNNILNCVGRSQQVQTTTTSDTAILIKRSITGATGG